MLCIPLAANRPWDRRCFINVAPAEGRRTTGRCPFVLSFFAVLNHEYWLVKGIFYEAVCLCNVNDFFSVSRFSYCVSRPRAI